jgi:anaphase-promoting complex subunit 2
LQDRFLNDGNALPWTDAGSLTDAEVGGDLYEELRRQDARPLEAVRENSDDEEECPTMDWQPAPSVTKPKGTFLAGGKGGGGDILAMLVSIYGSKELFVNEYRVMLAGKLLGNLEYNTDKEVHTLELLKLRFGELSMRNCEIMIKDMDDSKRAVTNIHSTVKASGKPAPVVDSAVVSHIFWPPLQNQPLKHHPRIQAQLDQYSAEFCRLKNPRRLLWLNQLGTVQLELDVAEEGPDGTPTVETREFNCSPLLATLISHFEDQETWTSEDLSNETGIAEHIIQKRMGYWVSNRVVKIVPSSFSSVVYQVASQEHMLQGEHDVDSGMMDLDHGDSQAVSLFAQEEEQMGVYESYIVGMLTNLGSLSLEKIHNMLKHYASGSDVKYDKTPQQLGTFLKYLCKQEKLECGPDGMYKLYKK